MEPIAVHAPAQRIPGSRPDPGAPRRTRMKRTARLLHRRRIWARERPGLGKTKPMLNHPDRARDATSVARREPIFGSSMRLSGMILNTYTRSHRFRPWAHLSYEQMFPSANSSLARRALDALRLTRSFLTLEDDYAVDWEVDWDEPAREAPHPHRVPLRGGSVRRRPGEPVPGAQPCLTPIAPAAVATRSRSRRPSSEMLYESGVPERL